MQKNSNHLPAVTRIASANGKTEPCKQPQPLDSRSLGQVGGGRNAFPYRGW
jgi:hypothetical protein